jgi:hypothetical protein
MHTHFESYRFNTFNTTLPTRFRLSHVGSYKRDEQKVRSGPIQKYNTI